MPQPEWEELERRIAHLEKLMGVEETPAPAPAPSPEAGRGCRNRRKRWSSPW